MAAAGAGIGGLTRVAAGAVTHNPVAEQNALNQTNQAINNRLAPGRAFLTAQQAQQGGTSLIKPILRGAGAIAPYAVGGLGEGIIKPALAFGGVNTASTALQGDLKPKDLAKSFALGAAPVGVGKAIGVGLRGTPTVAKAAQKYDVAQNQMGAVGKNVGALTPQERTAGRALGLSDKKTLQAKNADGLQKAFSNIVSTKSPEEMAALKSNEQMAVSNVLKHMGQQKNPVPSVKGASELPPIKPVSAATEFLSPKKNIPAKMGGSGVKISQAINNIESDTQALRAKWMAGIPTFQKLSKSDAAQAYDIKEGTAPAKGASPNVLKAVDELNRQTPQVAKTAFDQGVLIGDRGPNYMPHSYNFKELSKGSKYDAALQHLMDTQQVDHKTATRLFQNMAEENAGKSNFFGNLEHGRLTNMPGYAKTKQAYYDYLQRSAGRISEAKHFGVNNEIVKKHLDNLRVEGGDTNIAAKTIENYLRSADKGRGAGALRALRGVYAAGSLSKAAISHAGQLSNTAVEAGILRTAKNTAIRAAGGGKQLIRESGVTNPQELHAYREQYTAAGKVMSRATAPGLNSMMKFNRGSSALTGPGFANSLLKKGNIEKVRSLGVTGELGKKLTPNQELQAARGLTKDTVFGASRAETPLYAETKTGKLVGQFRTAYAYRQSRFIKDQVINEARKGNYAPLARYATLSAGIGYGTVAAKNKISGSKEGPGGTALDTAAGLGGIPGELLLQLARYGKRDVVKTAASSIAPIAGEAVTTGENIQKALGKNHPLAPLGRQALGHIPLVGSRASKAVLPPKNVPVAPNSSGNTAQKNAAAKAEVKALETNAGNGFGLRQLSNGKYAYTLDGDTTVHQTSSLKQAQTAVAEAQFKQEGNSYKVLGDTVYRKAADGTVAKTTKTKFDYQIGTATLTAQKNAGDIGGWLKTANSQLDSIAKQLKDPNIDPLDTLTLQNEADALQKNIAKYSGYGGFTKPKSAGSRTATRRAATAKAVGSFKVSAKAKAIPRPKGVSVRVPKAPAFKAPKTRKLSVSQIPTSYKGRRIA